MIFDTHIHIDNFAVPEPDRLLRSMDLHGVDRLGLLHEEPSYNGRIAPDRRQHNIDRLDRLMKWTKNTGGRLLPIYTIDPTEEDAIDQVDRALEAGVIGFKTLCEEHFPGDERAMPVYQHIADQGKAILFHAGTLWSHVNNGDYSRPCNWECMFEISNLRFALAHVAWPWCDETIALYGKFAAMENHPLSRHSQMYIDLTPGTPWCYRQKVINRLHDVGYDKMNERLLFGTDFFASAFDAKGVREQEAYDRNHLSKAGFDAVTIDNVMGKNALAFWGIK